MADCTKAIGLDPKHAWARFIPGYLYDDTQRWADEDADLKAYISDDNANDGYATFALAGVGFGFAEYAPALTDMNKFLVEHGDSVHGLLVRAQIEAKLGKFDDAKAGATASLRHSG